MTNRWQLSVAAFHRAFGITVGDTPAIREPELRAALLHEETMEFSAALARNDLPDAVDALCDVIYVALGTAVTFGVDLSRHFNAVHLANMLKAGGEKRDDGKQLKPPGWQPPDHDTLLRLQGWRGDGGGE